MLDQVGGAIGPVHRTATDNTQRIVFMASRQAHYQCLSLAAQRHFAMFEVSLLDHISIGDPPDASVRLAILGYDEGWMSVNTVRECRRRFPEAAIGLVVERGAHDLDSTLMEQHLVQGILPLTLPLDVWLAVASLLVAGGEYLSHDVSFHRDAPPPNVAGQPVDGLDTLTTRERQILQLVSAGYQNKLIADRTGLSEHTVKAHVHNLIAKLGLTNRTQAAAAFLQGQADQAQRGHTEMRAR